MRLTNRLIAGLAVLLLANTFAPWWWTLRVGGSADGRAVLWSGPSGWTGAVLVAFAGCWLGLGGGGRAGRLVAWGLPLAGGLVLLVDTLRWPKNSGTPSGIADYAPGSAAATFARDYAVRPGVYVGLVLVAMLTIVLRGVQRQARADTATSFAFNRPRPVGLILTAVTIALLALSFQPWARANAGWFSYAPLTSTISAPTLDATAWQSSHIFAPVLLLALGAVLAPSILARGRIRTFGPPALAALALALGSWERFRAHNHPFHGAGIQVLSEQAYDDLLHPYTGLSDAGIALLAAVALLVVVRSVREPTTPVPQEVISAADDSDVPTDAGAPQNLGAFVAIDSWAVRDGLVIGLEVHRHRFLAACGDAAEPEVAGAFFDRFVAGIPREGAWWPRVELGTDGELTSRLRPLPEPTGPLTVAVHQDDPRSFPRTKGPDLAALVRLRTETEADEVLLTHTDGSVLEGATTSLLWWDGDDLCYPDPALPVLPGVTSQLIRRHARAEGLRCVPLRVLPGELDGKETWLVNAVQGIRLVAKWSGTTITAGAPRRAEEWQEWLAAQAEPLPDRSADDA